MDNSNNYYKILDVPKDASFEYINNAYRKLALKWHPDKYLNDEKCEALTRFKRISEAFQILSDPKKRKLYDRSLKYKKIINWKNLKQPFEIFKEQFQTSNDQNLNIDDKNKSTPIIVELECTLEELYSGTQKVIKYNRYVYNKKKLIERDLKIDIERGCKNDTKIIYKSLGNEEYNKNAGDLIVIIKERKHKIFQRIENDLHVIIDISYKEACCGFKKEIELLDKKLCIIEMDYLPRSNNEYRIIGKGMPIQGSKIIYGDLIIKFNVIFEKLDNFVFE